MVDTASHSIPTGLYQLMPMLTDDEFEALKRDISEHGVLVPIVLDDEGNILDGHHRLAAIAQLEAATPGLTIPYNTEIRRNLTDEQKRDYVVALNLMRRHLSREQRLQLLVALRKGGHTLEKVAELSGMSIATAWRRLQDAEAQGMDAQPAYTQGKDGKLYPTAYTVPSFMSFTELKKEERTEQRAVTRAAPVVGYEPSASLDVFRGDIRDTGAIAERIGLASVDAIITDPPYPREYVPLMEDLSRLAAKILKPGRPLVAMLGHAYLPQYYELLAKHLTYHWTIADVLGGANSVQHQWSAFVGWKPMLVFTNGPAQLPYYFLDTVRSPGPDKEYHVWGQDVKTFEILIYRFTPPGGRVCDPFLGGGTTGVAALRMQREFVGFDNEAEAIATSLNRLSTVSTADAVLDPEARPQMSEDGTGVKA